MEKINFEDGQLVSEGYVEIDGTQHQIHEAEYEGDTPLSAHILNLMQTNIEQEINNSSIVVSPTEPQANRKKVWMQKGKNLLDNSLIDSSITADTSKYVYLKLKPNTAYTLSTTVSKNLNNTADVFLISGHNTSGTTNENGAWNGNARTIISDSSGYLTVAYRKQSTSKWSDLSTYLFQLEQSSTATSYEAYVEPKIYVLNDNNVYEEFIKKEENIYSIEEKKIGTWIDGKDLYRKVVQVNSPSQVTSSEIIYSLPSNCNIKKLDGFLISNSKVKYNLNSYFASNDFIYTLVQNNGYNVAMKTSNTAYIGSKVLLIIEYTKTN